MNRHPELSLRQPEKLGNVRSRMLNPTVVGKYFDGLKELIDTLQLHDHPERIWNADECGKQFEHQPVKVMSQKGTRCVISRTSDDRANTTIMACGNANGDFMPPMLITKGKTSKSLHGFNIAEAPEGTAWTYQESGWINEKIAFEWFNDVFLKHCGPERPQMLIMDGHGSHECAELLDTAIEDNIAIFALPPHTTHYLQPLDRTVFGPFNTAYNFACTEFLSAHPSNLINKWTFPSMFTKAWTSAMTCSNLKNGFKATGIYPLNKDAIPSHAYDPSLAFEKEDTQATTSTDTVESEVDSLNDQQVTVQVHDNGTPASANVSATCTTTTEPLLTVQVQDNDTPALVDVSATCTANTEPLPQSVVHDVIMDSVDIHGLQEQLHVPESVVSPGSGPSLSVDAPPIDDPALLLDLIQSGKIEVVATAEENGIAEIPLAQWSAEVESLFLPPAPAKSTETKTTKRKKITSHRLLTSPEILSEKKRVKEEKEKKEKLKQERLERKKVKDEERKQTKQGQKK